MKDHKISIVDINRSNSVQEGFTLIELLVVIAIIGMLSSVVLASLNTARAKARDARRFSDLRQLQIATELYNNDTGHYPQEIGESANGIIGEGAGVDTLLAPYMSAIPNDPLGPGNGTYFYYYDGRHYCGDPTGRPYQAVIYAGQMEVDSNENYYDVCGGGGTRRRRQRRR